MRSGAIILATMLLLAWAIDVAPAGADVSLSSGMVCSGDSCTIPAPLQATSSGYLFRDSNSGPFCKVEDSDEYEPCAWQAQREADAKEALAEKERAKKAKSDCQAKSCLVVRQRSSFAYATYPPSYPPDWRCECTVKVPAAKAKKEPKK